MDECMATPKSSGEKEPAAKEVDDDCYASQWPAMDFSNYQSSHRIVTDDNDGEESKLNPVQEVDNDFCDAPTQDSGSPVPKNPSHNPSPTDSENLHPTNTKPPFPLPKRNSPPIYVVEE